MSGLGGSLALPGGGWIADGEQEYLFVIFVVFVVKIHCGGRKGPERSEAGALPGGCSWDANLKG